MDEDPDHGRLPLMTPVQILFTVGTIAFPTAILAAKYLFRDKENLSNEVIFGGEDREPKFAPNRSNFEPTAPWPLELPGNKEIEAYISLKEEVLNETGCDYQIKGDARIRLRHALMDRCQVHVAWLLQFEREQQSIERMARRGMMSEADFQKFNRFAERLDAEVCEVREEAGWLCDDPELSHHASEEIWRIAVQIWHQRRQEASQRGIRSAVTRVRAGTNESLKGLKSVFLSNRSAASTEGEVTSKAIKWPKHLPGSSAIQQYEILKTQLLRRGTKIVEGEDKQCLREMLMERCRQQVPWMHRLQQERQRVRTSIERAQWLSDAMPAANDVDKLNEFEHKCRAESVKIKEEAEWLGDEAGNPGMGDRIWPMAFELYAKANAVRAEHENSQRVHHEKTLKAYADHAARPWPHELPGSMQRLSYEQLKASSLKHLSPPAQAAMLRGRPAPEVIGNGISCQLRAALMSRCQQLVPLIQRLQAEGQAFKMAKDRGHVNDRDVLDFEAMDKNVKAEINVVKAEAEWLSDDTGSRVGMGDQIWPAAFQIYAKRRAEVARQIHSAKMLQRQQTQDIVLSEEGPVAAHAVD
mmetsp:Transcript_14950/g.44645  ORF Transcript_14950/g.44645 Transcript_14950/m.44645 type:complete len:583 (-) Transcript_14950:120-1868(-)